VTIAGATDATGLVIFRLDDQRYALELLRVERVLPRVALTPFPKAPALVDGVFDFQGELVPAINLRRRFRWPERAPRLEDQLLVVRTPRRRLALVIDAVENVISVSAAELTAPADIVPGLEFVRGVVRLPREGIVFVHDLDQLLSLEEEARLEAALDEAAR